MSVWVDVDGMRIQPLADGGILWEHDTAPGYRVPRHMVSPADGRRWEVVAREPLSLMPSLYCDPARGGCGLHGMVSGGHWS